jgi:hypothetical protein
MALEERPTSVRLVGAAAGSERLKQEIEALESLDLDLLRKRWRSLIGRPAPSHLSRGLLVRILAYRHQVNALGDLDRATLAALQDASGETITAETPTSRSLRSRSSAASLKPGALLMREYGGVMRRVMVMEEGYSWNGKAFRSLSEVALAITGTKWNGPRFFGLRPAADSRKTANPVGASNGESARRGRGGRLVAAASKEGAP